MSQYYSDPMDQASAESDIHREASLNTARAKSASYMADYPPQEDGECACGCGNEVHPARLKIGFGLSIECAERLERKGTLK